MIKDQILKSIIQNLTCFLDKWGINSKKNDEETVFFYFFISATFVAERKKYVMFPKLVSSRSLFFGCFSAVVFSAVSFTVSALYANLAALLLHQLLSQQHIFQ